METTINSLEKINEVAKNLLEIYDQPCVIAFYGKMGAGKTTLIKALCKELQVIDTVTSPTFSIINEYQTIDGQIVYHFDFYRMEKEEELFDMGVEEYFDRDAYCFIEWPEKAEHILPMDTQIIKIEVNETGERNVIAYNEKR